MKKALFLDRDGVINKDIGYAYKPEDIVFVEGIFELCQYYQAQDYLIIVVTNQSGIARGYYSETDFDNLCQWMQQQFKQHDISIHAFYHCPHHPKITGDCDCRKPASGMLEQAMAKYHINPKDSIMIGDKVSDMQAAVTAGIGQRIYFNAEKLEDSSHNQHITSLSELIMPV